MDIEELASIAYDWVWTHEIMIFLIDFEKKPIPRLTATVIVLDVLHNLGWIKIKE